MRRYYPVRGVRRNGGFGIQILVTLLLCTGALRAQNCVAPPPGLVGWWKGNGDATETLGTNNGTLVGNASFAPGVVGQAFSFDGDNDSVMIGNPATLQLQNFTIEAWIKRASTNQVTLDTTFLAGTIFGYGYGGYTFVVSVDGRLAFGKVGISGINATNAIRDANWHHVAVTKSSGSVTFYVDGQGEAAQQYDPGFDFISSAQIGASQWDGTRPTASFLGLIDEVSVYNRALSGTDVASIYAAGALGKCPLLSEPPCVQPPSGLVSWWKGDGDANDVIGGNLGTLQGGVTFVPGKVGQAFSFDGVNDYISFGNTVGNFGTNDFTIDFWIKTTATRLESVIEKWPVCGHASMFTVRIGGPVPGAGKLSAVFEQDDIGSNPNSLISARQVNDGVFHHVALIRKGTNASFYIDGILDSTASSPGITRISNSVDLVAGRSVCVGVDGTSPFSGQLDEISVYHRALSTSEIQGIYQANGAGKCHLVSEPQCVPRPSGLVSWWKGDGGTIDAVGTNNGTLVGNASIAPGFVGQAFRFDGDNDSVMLGNPPNLQLQNFTIEAWIKRARTNQASLDVFAVGHIFGYGYGGYIFGLSDDGRLGLGQVGISGVNSTNSIKDTNWHHVAVTKASGAVVFYVDGVDEVVPQYNPVFYFTSSAQIGASQWDGTRPTGSFLGSIDEVSLYNRALSGTEVASIYAASSAGKCLPPPPITAFANGSFESPTLAPAASVNLPAGSTTALTGWTVGNTGVVGFVNGPAFGVNPVDGLQHIGFNGGNTTTGGSVSQTFTTTVGQIYVVGFYLGRIGSGSGTMSLHAAVTSNSGAILGSLDATAPASPGYGPAQTFTFAAATATSTLTFTDTSSATIAVDLLLDNVSVVPIPACAPPLIGLISWWSGDGNANDVQDSNNGTPQNGTTFTAGKVGQSFSFDGVDDQVLVPHNANQNTGSQITIDAWVNPSSSGHGPTILQKRSASNVGGYVFEMLGQPFGPDNGLQFVIMIGGTYYSCSTTNSVLTLNAWQHVAATYDGSAMRIYVNGVQQASTAVSGAIDAVTDPITIGRNVVFPAYAWQGLIDEVDLFNRALSSSEIQAIYNAGIAGKCSANCLAVPAGLVGWWRAEGNTLDLGGTNNGTLAGDAAYGSGQVGQGFVFDGNGDGVQLGNAVALQLQNFTIECWIKRASLSTASYAPDGNAVLFSYGTGGYGIGITASGNPFLTKVDINGPILSASIGDTNFHHLAVTKVGSVVFFYIDGVAYSVPAYNSTFVFSSNVAIGATGDSYRACFLGSIDEIAIYNRALTPIEIQAIYNAASAGKCPFPPPISVSISPPAGFYTNALTVTLSSTTTNVSIRYTLDGATPTTNSLVYAGPFALTNTATVSALAFTNGIQASELAVSTFRFWGASSGCVAPAGAISWWTGDSNTRDVLGLNSGDLAGNTAFVPGFIGQALSLNGEGDAVTIANSPSLQLQNFTIEAWIKRRSTNQSSLGIYGSAAFFSYGTSGYAFGIFDDGRLLLSKVGGNAVASTVVIANTGWHHAAVTKSGTNVSFFLDGVSAGNAIFNTTFSFSSNPAIGATGDSLIASFYGLIDELAIYARPLATNEIQALFSAGASGKCSTFAPIIVTPPQNRTVPVGANTSFSVTAGGSPILSYQWSLNGSPILDATNAVLAMTNVNATNAGTYAVTVSNGFAPPATASATLTVSVPPTITQQPRSQTVLVGSTATFTVGYTGTPPLTFQWRRNGTLITGGSSPTLVINNVQSANAGTYTVRISNALNFVLSDPATLTVASGQFSALTQTVNGIQLNVQGELGGNYIIETSSDLKQWDPLATLLNNPQNWQFTDTTASGVGQRFYRLRKSP